MVINYETNIEKVLKKRSGNNPPKFYDVISKELRENTFFTQNKIIYEKLDPKKIFHIKDIKKVCVDYRLRFLDSSFYKGKIPNNREELEYLPGVGRKTANVVLNEGFGYATIAVDTHVFRVSNRTGLAIGKNVLDTEKELLRVTPEKWAKNAHRYLILHGRYVCKARSFDCKQCVINKECEYPEKN